MGTVMDFTKIRASQYSNTPCQYQFRGVRAGR